MQATAYQAASASFTSCPSRPTAQPIVACMVLGSHRGAAFSQTQCHSTGVDEGGAAIHLSCQSEAQEKRYKVFLNLSFPGQHPPTPPPEDPLYLFFTWQKEKLGPVLEGSHRALQLWGMVSEHFFSAPPLDDPLEESCQGR